MTHITTRSLLLIAGLALSTAAAAKDDKVLATIGKTKITEGQYKEALKRIGPQAMMINSDKSLRIQLLNQIINLEVFSREAQKLKLDQKPEYKQRVEMFKKESLANMLLKDKVKGEMSDKKIKAYYDKNKSKYAAKEVRASHILLKETDKKKAEKLLKEAQKKGANFAELAKKNSTGPSASKGGDLNFFGKGQMLKEFEQAAFSTAKGKVHPKLVKTQYGYHIIKVTDIKDPKSIKFADKKAEVTRDYRTKAREDVIAGLKKKYAIKIDNKALNDMVLK